MSQDRLPSSCRLNFRRATNSCSRYCAVRRQSNALWTFQVGRQADATVSIQYALGSNSPLVTGYATRFNDIAVDMEPFLSHYGTNAYYASQSFYALRVDEKMRNLDASRTRPSPGPLMDHDLYPTSWTSSLAGRRPDAQQDDASGSLVGRRYVQYV